MFMGHNGERILLKNPIFFDQETHIFLLKFKVKKVKRYISNTKAI